MLKAVRMGRFSDFRLDSLEENGTEVLAEPHADAHRGGKVPEMDGDDSPLTNCSLG